jgi:iron complex outermembrane receptor protein
VQAISTIETASLTASTPNLFHLPSGDVGFGVGTEFRHEGQSIDSGAGSLAGEVTPARIQTVSGSRNVEAVYYQIDIPIVPTLRFSQLTRYDQYSDVGGAVSPRFALRWQPISPLTVYGSYTRGFRAPTLVEASNSQTLSVQTASDANDPINGGELQTIQEVTKGNPNLSPERTKNYNLGF